MPILPTTRGPLSPRAGRPPTSSQVQGNSPPSCPLRSMRRCFLGCLPKLFSCLSQRHPGPGRRVKHCGEGREGRAVLSGGPVRGGPDLGVSGQAALTQSCAPMFQFLERKGRRCFSRGRVKGDLTPGDPEVHWGWLPWLLFQIGIALTPCPQHLYTQPDHQMSKGENRKPRK